MRPLALTILAAAVLCACSPSPQPAAPEAKPAPPATPASAPKPAEPTAAAPAPAKEIPEGDCGDQSKLPPEQRIANTARWTTASEQNNFGFDVFRGDKHVQEIFQ